MNSISSLSFRAYRRAPRVLSMIQKKNMMQAEARRSKEKEKWNTLKAMIMSWNRLFLLQGVRPKAFVVRSSMWTLCVCTCIWNQIAYKHESFVFRSGPWRPPHWFFLKTVLRVGALEMQRECMWVVSFRGVSSLCHYLLPHTLRLGFLLPPQSWRVRVYTYK